MSQESDLMNLQKARETLIKNIMKNPNGKGNIERLARYDVLIAELKRKLKK